MVKINCSRKRYLLVGVISSASLIVMVVCILFITQRIKESNNKRDVYSYTNDTLEIPMDLVNQLTSESEPTTSILETTTIPQILIDEEHNENPENTPDVFTQSSSTVSIQSILRAIRIPRMHINEIMKNKELKSRTSDASTQVSTSSTELEGTSETAKVKTICAKQERDQLKRHRDQEHAQLLRIRENEHGFKEIEHAQLFDMMEKEKVLIEEEHELKMKILLEKLLYYQRLNNGTIDGKI